MKPQRLDKFLSSQCGLSRKDVTKQIAAGRVTVNGALVRKGDSKVIPDQDMIRLDGRTVQYKPFLYLMMNKPKGVISASNDKSAQTVVDLVPEDLYREGLFPAGRLDKDSEGFVLLTDDGEFAHRLLAPKNHVPKTYLVTVDGPVTDQVVEGFKQGTVLHSGERCMDAQLTVLSSGQEESLTQVVLREGMYHQIKRMFGVYHLGVNALRRVKIGAVELDETLAPGECRELTEDELSSLNNRT